MSVQITIRNVPEEVRDELASRAALRRQSMQQYLREELERLAGQPSVETVLEDVRRRKEASDSNVTVAQILETLDTNRRYDLR
jgi:plasmid stability protein